MRLLLEYQTYLVTQITTGGKGQRLRRAHIVVTQTEHADARRALGDISVNDELSVEAKIADIMSGLMDTLETLKVLHLHSITGATAVREGLETLLSQPDPDVVFKKVTDAVDGMVRKLFAPFLDNHPSGKAACDLLLPILSDVEYALARFRHNDFGQERTVDHINLVIGYHLGRLGASPAAVTDAHPLGEEIWHLLDPHTVPASTL